MTFEQFLRSAALTGAPRECDREWAGGAVDLSRTAGIEITRALYGEAEARGLSLSELLELDDYDPSPAGAPLDAFERQLALAGIRFGGKTPTTVEQFYQQAPALLPEFMRREIRAGQAMRPELRRLIANTAIIASNTYTPFFIDTTDAACFSLRPVAEGAETPQVLVTEQNHAVRIADYGLALKASYKALRYRTASQFRVLLWYIGFRLQTDKIGMLVETILNGDGNDNAAAVITSAASGVLAYDDLVNLWSQFAPFEMNTIICGVNLMKEILTLDEFKDPMAGYRFQNTGDLFSPLGASLVRCDELAADLIVGLDSRFAIEEVVTQPLTIEYDKIIEQRFEEAVISESVAYAKVIHGAAVVLDTVHA
ncbi:MAG TPA: hypothetical protein PKW75_02995 [candidate division Zixibacteria bacterium]|nr:hypothetical protein [candidate division Zixibacteria bacterium]MDD4916859.1 hypothetical protein [candidate division Zixibacteria bacterium]MDM7971447.1 hypothetical protein [candidate division Zixibacteria bacterium]HOD65139.1 hypothetical protein [candidate division Zixibacteria bacterium]HOZ07230.1 hypothetical protein [candidate division Zixibacteria bacterium]